MNQRTSDYKLNETTFRVCYGDITKLVADALVSSDDNYLTMGGGVSMALLRAGGEEISREARKHIPLKLVMLQLHQQASALARSDPGALD